MQAMILAAGLGTRLLPYSMKRPKPLFPVLDQPLLSLTIHKLRTAGFTCITVNGHHLHEQLEALLASEGAIRFQFEEEILGTGGGLRKALPGFSEQPLLVTNGDIFHSVDFTEVYQDHRVSGADVTMVLHDFPRFNNVCVADDGMVTGFVRTDEPSHPEQRRLAFTGIHVVNPGLLKRIPPVTFHNIIDCYRQCIKEGLHVRGLVMRGCFWTDIGTPNDYLDLHANLLDKSVGACGYPIAAPSGTLFLGNDVSLGERVRFIGWASVGSRAVIGAGAEISRSVVWDGAVVAPGSVIADAIVM